MKTLIIPLLFFSTSIFAQEDTLQTKKEIVEYYGGQIVKNVISYSGKEKEAIEAIEYLEKHYGYYYKK